MVPDEIVRFLEGATVGYAGTRDDKLVPQICHVSGWIVGPDRQTITCLIPDDHSKTLTRSLEDNGRFALLVIGSTTGPKASNPPNPAVDSHECYQFKGDYVGSRRAADGEISVVDQARKRFQELFVALFGFSEEAAAAYIRKPGVALTFRVREIFDQTPGPGAGSRIVPGGGVMGEVKLPEEIKPVMENGIPAQVVTCSAEGIPNVTVLSRVYYVDRGHVALSNQFFSKTVRNVRENPRACLRVADIEGFTAWILQVEFDHSETEGPTFDAMDMQIEAIASMTGMSDVFKLKAADIYRVTSVEKIEYGPAS